MSRLLAALAIASVLITSAVRFQLAGQREFDPDEFQHLHTAWCISQGLVPYVDFFEHHMPGLPLLLSAMLPLDSASRSAANAVSLLESARLLMWVCSFATIGLTWLLAHDTGGPEVASAATALLTFSIIFTGKGLEIRPDGPATACWVLSLLLFVRALEGSGYRRGLFFGSGLALGVALIFTQKLLLAGPGFAVVALWAWTRRDDARPLLPRVVDTALQLAGVAVPLAAILAWQGAHGAGGAFVASTLLQNLGWVKEVSAQSTLSWLAKRDPILMALGTLGAMGAAIGVVRRQPRAAAVVMLCAAGSLVIGLFVIPAPYPQYLLPVLPLLAVFAAGLVTSAARHAGWTWPGLAVVAAFAFCLLWARPVFMAPWVYPAVFAALLALAATFARQRPTVAVAIVVVAASLYQVQQLRWMRGLTNERQLTAMALVHRLTAGARPAVLDGFTGYGWFRPHAWRYSFLHSGVRARLTEADRRELAAGLRSGQIAPGVVLFDSDLQAVSIEVGAAVKDAYEPTDTTPVWAPKRRSE